MQLMTGTRSRPLPWIDADLPPFLRRAYPMAMPAVQVPRFAVDDLDAFPSDGNRYELLDGALLVTPAPGLPHQLVATRLICELHLFLRDRPEADVVGPGVVELRPRTHLEPDILVVPRHRANGATWNDIRHWWLAVEVLSPSSRAYDCLFKRDAYLAPGVREVWLVALDAQSVLVSRRGGPIDERFQGRLLWRPDGIEGEVLLDLGKVFEALDG